jgi:hypothetical protein
MPVNKFLNPYPHYYFALGIVLLHVNTCFSVAAPTTKGISTSPSAIVTDRPSFTYSLPTVPEGSLQIENGITWSNINDAGSTSYPETALRLGVSPHDEVQLYLPNVLESRAKTGLATTGVNDVRIGAKHRIHRPLPFNTQASVVGVLSLPTGTSDAASSGVDPSVSMVLAKAMTPRLTIFQQTGVNLDTSLPEGNVSINPTLNGTYQFTPAVSGFLEYSGFIRLGNTSTHIVDAGCQYVFKQRHAVDARVGSGLFNGEGGAFAGVGYSYRWDSGWFNSTK